MTPNRRALLQDIAITAIALVVFLSPLALRVSHQHATDKSPKSTAAATAPVVAKPTMATVVQPELQSRR